MPGAWRVIDAIGYRGEVAAGKGHLYIGEQSIALMDVAVLMVGPHCILHESTFDRAAVFDVSIVHCDWKGVPIATTFGWSENSRVATRQRAQASLSVPRQKNAWMRIVKSKIRGQAEVLRYFKGNGYSELTDLSRAVKSGDPSNVEARAARFYWRALDDGNEFRRLPGSREGLNGFLDYTYAVLRGVCVRAVVSAGLNPALGIWHHERANNFALVDDVIEPFRPAADLIAITARGRHATLDSACKKDLVSVCETTFDRSGATVSTVVSHFARKFAIYAEGESPALEVPVFEVRSENG